MLVVVRAALLVALTCCVACVNNYVVRDAEDDGGTTTGCPMDECGQGDTANADGPAAFECVPCESDVDCGDAWDNCIPLDVIGQNCVAACPEAGCAEGFVCRSTLSVDGVQAEQCVPRMPTCAGTTGG